MSTETLDLTSVRAADRLATLTRTLAQVPKGYTVIVVTDVDPRELMSQVDAEHAGGIGWDVLNRGPEQWTVRITKVASTALPRVVCRSDAICAGADAHEQGPLWKLQAEARSMDAVIIAIPAKASVPPHFGPDMDVLVHVVEGSGELRTERDTIALTEGVVMWLPAKSQRSLTAGPTGLRYLSVHGVLGRAVATPRADEG